jgi:hypothetical protein
MQGSGRCGDACRVVARPAASVPSRHLSFHPRANAGVVCCFLGEYLSIAVAPASFLGAGSPGYHTMVLSRV